MGLPQQNPVHHFYDLVILSPQPVGLQERDVYARVALQTASTRTITSLWSVVSECGRVLCLVRLERPSLGHVVLFQGGENNYLKQVQLVGFFLFS